jgi:hypothetical protein
MNLWRQDKGQESCVRAFVEAIRNGTSAPISMDELLEVAHVTISIASHV